MPIKPENKKLYPKDWKQIRKRILERARNRCEFCLVANYVKVNRNDCGIPADLGLLHNLKEYIAYKDHKAITIVLTIAHLDHDPTNNDPENLRALCQKCHLTYDAKHHAHNAHETRRKGKAIGELFDVKA
jgi:hypothetical protein